IGSWTGIRMVETTLIALLGGVLGVLFTISLRRILVVEEDLPFPEGVASAEVLFAGWEGGSSAKYVFTALIIGFAYKAVGVLHLAHEKIEGVFSIGAFKGFFGLEMSAALVSVGYIIGPKIASFVFMGGMIGYVFILPVFLTQAFAGGYPGIDPLTMSPMDIFYKVKADQIIWVGIGAIVFGGVWTMIGMRSSVGGAFNEAIRGIKGQKVDTKDVPRTEKDLPIDKSFLAAAALVIPIAGLYFWLTESAMIAGVSAVVMLIAAFFFTAISGYMAGVLGSSNNPISGVTITTILFASILLFIMGARGTDGMSGALAVGAVVCCSAAIAGDVLQDFKTGQIVGSTPKNLQIGEMIGVVATALSIGGVLILLTSAYGIGPGTGLEAPQAQVMAGVLQAFFGGTVNFIMFLAGMELAIILVLLKIPILAVAIGIYLPFTLSTPIMLGGVIHAVVDRVGRRNHGGEMAMEKLHNRGILYSSGLIAGEAMMGIVGAVIILMFTPYWEPMPLLGIVFFAIVVFLLMKTALGGVGGNLEDGGKAAKELANDFGQTVKSSPGRISKLMKK
ncbi:MAG: oligopeptide transporter, OPT family, partial [Candidatus Thermoplasmatota archaeon]|nr:oligopeptide transporter, OPT family [Candidatus Thermoplasmatota archaeon]